MKQWTSCGRDYVIKHLKVNAKLFHNTKLKNIYSINGHSFIIKQNPT